MSLETIEVYKDTYRSLVEREFDLITKNAEMVGTIRALAEMDDSPEFVLKMLKEMVDKFDK